MNNEPRVSFFSYIYSVIYGGGNYELLKGEQRPTSECWHKDKRYLHCSHITPWETDKIAQLTSLGNHLSDKMEWLFESIGKISLDQAKANEEVKLRLDLIETYLIKIDNEIPENFGHAFKQMYEDLMKAKEDEDRLVKGINEVCSTLQSLSSKIVAIGEATGAEITQGEL